MFFPKFVFAKFFFATLFFALFFLLGANARANTIILPNHIQTNMRYGNHLTNDVVEHQSSANGVWYSKNLPAAAPYFTRIVITNPDTGETIISNPFLIGSVSPAAPHLYVFAALPIISETDITLEMEETL